MQIIDNLLPREEPMGHFLGQVALRLAGHGVPINVIAASLLQRPKTIQDLCERAYGNGFLSIVPSDDWPAPLNKIQQKNVVPRRKPSLRQNAKSRGRKNRA